MFKSLALIAALAFGCFASAKADPINGSLAIAGFSDTWTSTSVDFSADPVGTIGATTGTYTTLALDGQSAFMASGFTYTVGDYSGAPQLLFLADGSAVGYSITAISSAFTDGSGLHVVGSGIAFAPGYDSTLSNFKFNTSDSGAASFQATLNTVPEPTSLALFGTGLLGIVGIARRKFNV